MSKKNLLIVSTIVSIIISTGVFTKYISNTANSDIYAENYDDNLFIFRPNDNGKIIEYVLIQGLKGTPVGITDFFVSEDGREATIVKNDDNTWVYSIDDELVNINGIGHFICSDPEGVDRDDILQDVDDGYFAEFGGGGNKKNCDKECLSGGCGASSCSRTVSIVSCSITCDSEYFACCADLATAGCHCKIKKCCTATPDGPTISPGG